MNSRPLVWPALVVALLLAGITGFVDAVAYDRFLGVFPANQSGNAVFLGTSIGSGGNATGWQSGTSMAAPHVAGLAALLWQTEEEHPAEATRLLLHKYAASVGDPADINASGWGFPSFVQ